MVTNISKMTTKKLFRFRAPIADIECLDDLNVLAKNIDDKFAQYSNSKTRSFNDIKYNNLGKSGLRISNIGFGKLIGFFVFSINF